MPLPPRLRVAAALALLSGALTAAPGALTAQRPVTGVVRDSATGAAVPGAVVLGLGAAGDTVARALTTERGVFRLDAPRAVARLQALRIGYRPRAIALDAARPEDTAWEIGLARLPTLLERVQVTAAARCRGRPDRAEAWALLEQARAALLAMIVARETDPATVTRLAYTRTFDQGGTRIARQHVRRDSSADATTSFNASRSAADFVRDGFRTLRGAEEVLYGPDAEVLLDDGFARGYCFHLAAPDPARPLEAGVAFSPARSRRGRVDIEGTLWIDTVSRSVTDIEFRYRGLDRDAERAGAGGRVQFREMPGGVVFIARWWLRTLGPAPDAMDGPDEPDARARPVPRRGGAAPLVLTEIGGELVRARWADGSRYDAPLGAVAIELRTEAGAPVVGALVGLARTDHLGVTDSMGRVLLGELLPGPYRAVLVDSLLAPLGIVLPVVGVEVAPGDTAVHRRTAPSLDDFVADLCRAGGVGAEPAVLLGRIVDADGTPADGVRWRLRRSDGTRWSVVADGGRTGSDGRLQLCRGLAVGDVIELAAWRDRETPEIIVRRVNGAFTAIPVVLPPRVVAGAMPQFPVGARVRLTGTVRDGDTPVSDARLSLAGTLLETATDSSGAYLLGGIPRGEYTVEVRTPWLDSIGAVQRARVVLADTLATLDIALPTAADLVRATCGPDATGGVLVGRLRGAGVALPTAGAARGGITGWRPEAFRITAEWPERAMTIFGAGRVVRRTRWVEGRVDARGTWRLCGVPLDDAVTVTVSLDGDVPAVGADHSARDSASAMPVPGVPAAAVVVSSARRFHRVDLLLDTAGTSDATFTGRVVDSAGTPIRNAEIALPDLDRATLTNDDGAFRLAGIAAGTHVVSVRRDGFIPVTARVPFAAGRTVEHRIALQPVTRPAGDPPAAPGVRTR
jgi:hypothetical protein